MAEIEKTQIYQFPQEEIPEMVRTVRAVKLPIIDTVKTTGFFLLLMGVCISLYIAVETIQLYQHPENMEHLAVVIEKGSNIDHALMNNLHKTNDNNSLRLSYFVAWLLNFMLIMLISMISLAFIKTGASLVQNTVEKNENRKISGKLDR